MTKQAEIEKALAHELRDLKHKSYDSLQATQWILRILDSLGVVRKVDREPSTYLKENGEEKYYGDMPYEMYEDGWRRFEPLIEDGKDNSGK